MSNQSSSKLQIETILRIFSELYPNPTTELIHDGPWQLLVATMLSAQCTDKRVNMITPRIFARFPAPEDLAKASPTEVEMLIKDCGLFHNKARNLIATAKRIVEDYGGQVPSDREALMTLPGVGRKTANVVLANCFGVDAIAVDTHVFRLAHRLGWTQAKDVQGTEEDLMRVIPQKQWAKAHHWLIFHGRRICSAKHPDCERCPIQGLCPQIGVSRVKKESS
ncbi:MAG: endonuclease III [Sulfobacillus thermosulfidooxidans]|uniref:Endonuclease III n=1 Tax=Sulfobacillus thermosulfidooxidans TaxID=28034 RepID=A0A2T2X3K4_SULTH|nr:MAG: endonuclease III [Sulfobacillus thermosulfidooxidans]